MIRRISQKKPSCKFSYKGKIIKSSLFAIFLFTSINIIGQNQNEPDRFAKIGLKDQSVRMDLLEEKIPPVLPGISLPVTHNSKAVFKPVHSMNSKEELYTELDRLRKEYEPFLQDITPSIEDKRIRIPLNEFNWRIETKNDIQDFASTLNGEGEWKRVSIPHYDEPLGRAVTYYYRTFTLSPEMLKKGNLFACFKGVDYKAHVFINGAFLGSHEGFFAPFEFNFTKYAQEGENNILIKVENDFTTTSTIGNKIYAATGPGFDNPQTGWHHCPAAMGIYQNCYIEARSALHINDVFVRPIVDKEKAEVWLEINNFSERDKECKISFSVYGQNFEATVLEDYQYSPQTVIIPGVGDLAKPTDWEKKKLKMGYGVNFLKVSLDIKNPRLWNNKTPWLYQLQVRLYDDQSELQDTRSCQFGMRSFTMDTTSIPRGRMYLNGEMIRLRGANTMGAYQQDVIKKDWDQLIDDILLAKIANMNFIRMTQRPVQEEIYEYFDRLGLMTQTDLPLFGTLRTNQWAEAVKQAEEMERLVRNHPCNIMVTYINERFPNAEGNPQRAMATADDFYRFFKACDQAVHMANPDRIIKAGDGDYDPPSPGLPDNHCYNAWYNGHGLGLGKMHKGYWQWVKPGWMYACGEFGAEGLDPLNVMEKYYPKEWLPVNKEDEKTWTANRIVGAQTQKFHYMWFNAQHSLPDWIEASQNHQAWATRLYTEAFRRDTSMVSFAIHLFIDAWPSGWMKTIMDVDRQPKKAYFVYRDALKPLMANLRTDRYNFYSGEEMKVEAWVCNDRNDSPENYKLKYQFEKNGKPLMANEINPEIPVNSSEFQGYLKIKAPKVRKRTSYQLRLALFNEKGEGVSQSLIDIDVFPKPAPVEETVFVAPSESETGKYLVQKLKVKKAGSAKDANTIIIDDFNWYKENQKEMDRLVQSGKTILFLELPQGTYQIKNTEITIENTNMGSYYFASPETGSSLVKWSKPMDFRFWYDQKAGYVTPFSNTVFKAPGWNAVLTSGNSNWTGDEGTAMAAGELSYGNGHYRICQIQLKNHVKYNPTAALFFKSLIENK